MGCVLVIDACARWWASGGVSGVEPGWDGSNGVALGVWVVPRDSVVVAVSYVSGAEREFGARGAARVGSSVSLVLVVLVSPHRRDNFERLVIGPAPLEHLAL